MRKEDKFFYGGIGLVILSFILTLLFGRESTLVFLFSACSLLVLGYGYYFKAKADNRQAKHQVRAEERNRLNRQ